MNDDKRNEELRRRKIENFRVQIPEDSFPQESGRSPREEPPAINSYSRPEKNHRAADVRMAERKAARRAAKAHKKRNKQKRGKNKLFFRLVWLMMVLFIGVALAQYAVTGINDMLAIGRDAVNVTVDIPKGASTDQIAQVLQEAGVIQRSDFFKLYSAMTKADGHYNNGTYKLNTSMDYEAIINNLQSNANRVDIVKITFTEGMNALEIAQLLEENGVCSQEDALNYINSNALDSKYDFLQQLTGDRYYHMEGYLFPDTYEFFKDESPEDAILKLVNNCDRKLTDEIRQEITASGMTIDQVMTLASMIQAEAADEDDMYMISSVFHNRLNSDGSNGLRRLQSDPTMYYPYRTRDAIPEDIRESYSSKYNTYEIEGLPAGPICNPGSKAIDAALHPADTNYYYFCHDADRNAYYAETLEQHQQNLQKAGLR